MNLLIEKGVIEEIECGANFAYVLKDNSSFLLTEYKVLQSQTNSSLCKCMKMLYNGKIELYYLVNSYKPLSALLPQLDPDHFITIVWNLLAGILDVKNNGFLSCLNIDSSFEHIYVDSNTFKVELVYLPLNKHEYSDTSSFENALRTNLVRIIEGASSLSSPKTTQLRDDLQNGMLSIEAICSRLGGKDVHHASKQRRMKIVALNAPTRVKVKKITKQEVTKVKEETNKDSINAAMRRTMKMVALNAPTRVEVKITKPEFTIGKDEKNDGIIDFNKMISKVHCKVTNDGQQFMISDLQSAIGTYVNGVRLQPNVPFPLNNGDVVRLAKSDFRIVIE